MDALKGFMIYIEQFLTMLAPIVRQGTAGLDPLVHAHPWPFLVGAFVVGVFVVTLFRAFTGFLLRLIMLPILLVVGYILYSSGSHVFSMVLPLIKDKLGS